MAAKRTGLQGNVTNHDVREKSIFRHLDADVPGNFVTQLSGHTNLKSLDSTSNETLGSGFFEEHPTFKVLVILSPVLCQFIAAFGHISSSFVIFCEWEVFYFQLPEVLPSTAAKVKHNLKENFWRVLGSLKLKTPHSYSFRRSFSKIAGLCSTLAKPCRFKSTHLARNTLFALANSGSCIMLVPFVLKCLLSPNRKDVVELFEYGLPSLFFRASV